MQDNSTSSNDDLRGAIASDFGNAEDLDSAELLNPLEQLRITRQKIEADRGSLGGQAKFLPGPLAFQPTYQTQANQSVDAEPDPMSRDVAEGDSGTQQPARDDEQSHIRVSRRHTPSERPTLLRDPDSLHDAFQMSNLQMAGLAAASERTGSGTDSSSGGRDFTGNLPEASKKLDDAATKLEKTFSNAKTLVLLKD
jgi:hypothetical protein